MRKKEFTYSLITDLHCMFQMKINVSPSRLHSATGNKYPWILKTNLEIKITPFKENQNTSTFLFNCSENIVFSEKKKEKVSQMRHTAV